jgi:hypothetical protein
MSSHAEEQGTNWKTPDENKEDIWVCKTLHKKGLYKINVMRRFFIPYCKEE